MRCTVGQIFLLAIAVWFSCISQNLPAMSCGETLDGRIYIELSPKEKEVLASAHEKYLELRNVEAKMRNAFLQTEEIVLLGGSSYSVVEGVNSIQQGHYLVSDTQGKRYELLVNFNEFSHASSHPMLTELWRSEDGKSILYPSDNWKFNGTSLIPVLRPRMTVEVGGLEYSITYFLGSGAQGAVYSATSEENKNVILKTWKSARMMRLTIEHLEDNYSSYPISILLDEQKSISLTEEVVGLPTILFEEQKWAEKVHLPRDIFESVQSKIRARSLESVGSAQDILDIRSGALLRVDGL